MSLEVTECDLKTGGDMSEDLSSEVIRGKIMTVGVGAR